jgi:Uma2 family endonuclease
MSMLETKQALSVYFSPLLHRYTLEEFWALPEPEGRGHYDLIGGYLFMVPPPDPPHGDIGAFLTVSLSTHLAAHGMPGKIYHPREAIWTDGTYVEPDMMYVSNELRASMGERRTSADMVFEYLSPSTANYDRTTKADTYLALGVRELWLVDPETVSIEVRHGAVREERPIWQIHRYTAGAWAESQVLPGWRVSVDELFAGLV